MNTLKPSPSFESYDSIMERIQEAVRAKLNKSPFKKSKNDGEESDDLGWEFEARSDADDEELVAFRNDIEPPLEQEEMKVTEPQRETPMLDFETVLSASQRVVDFQEKYLQKRFSQSKEEAFQQSVQETLDQDHLYQLQQLREISESAMASVKHRANIVEIEEGDFVQLSKQSEQFARFIPMASPRLDI
ncbi:hypothetical protein EDD86DRAFT_204610 [Gorgonomyces haynaldii]|nr:hypothetical protein EDD86DRAFT_204610 [Gorgonomyces haynaldii]